MRLIDADALIKTLEVANEELLELTGYETELCLYDVIQIIKDMPAIDSVKRGEWIYQKDLNEDGNRECNCSLCGAGGKQSPSAKVPYCWRCGAFMSEGKQ